MKTAARKGKHGRSIVWGILRNVLKFDLMESRDGFCRRGGGKPLHWDWRQKRRGNQQRKAWYDKSGDVLFLDLFSFFLFSFFLSFFLFFFFFLSFFLSSFLSFFLFFLFFFLSFFFNLIFVYCWLCCVRNCGSTFCLWFADLRFECVTEFWINKYVIRPEATLRGWRGVKSPRTINCPFHL